MLDQAKLVAQKIKDAGGRALVVGGFVRDMYMSRVSKDLDVEVYGLSLDQLETVLRQFGTVETVGKAFGVFKVHGLNLDISVPRRDSKNGTGHRGFTVEPDPSMSVTDAARRRDLTMNSIALDPLTGEVFDPFNGRKDIADKVLRATDVKTFGEDPLRALRVAQFAARFGMWPDQELLGLMRQQNMSELPGERLIEEFKKLLLKGMDVKLGLDVMHQGGLLKFFPEIEALVNCPQEPDWHPEGDVFIHTGLVVNVAATLRTGDEAHDMALMFACLCHDFGKPPTTKVEDGKIRAKGHDAAGEAPTRSFLERLRFPLDLTEQVVALVLDHLTPMHFHRQPPKASAYRRLARKLAAKGTTMEMLEKVSRSDSLGRTTPDALAGTFEPGVVFLEKSKDLDLSTKPMNDVVMGRHLLARGMRPGPEFGKVLDKCREVQYETGSTDAEEILTAVLKVHG